MTAIQTENPLSFKIRHMKQLLDMLEQAKDKDKPAYADRIADLAHRLDEQFNPKPNDSNRR